MKNMAQENPITGEKRPSILPAVAVCTAIFAAAGVSAIHVTNSLRTSFNEISESLAKLSGSLDRTTTDLNTVRGEMSSFGKGLKAYIDKLGEQYREDGTAIIARAEASSAPPEQQTGPR